MKYVVAGCHSLTILWVDIWWQPIVDTLLIERTGFVFGIHLCADEGEEWGDQKGCKLKSDAFTPVVK